MLNAIMPDIVAPRHNSDSLHNTQDKHKALLCQMSLCEVSHFLIAMLSVIMLIVVMLNVVATYYALCHCAKCRIFFLVRLG
jgi:hypothetical protein